MRIRVPDYYKDFKCIASECEDTCCAGWEIVIDDETYEVYKAVNDKFGDRLKNEIITDEDGEKIFVLKGDNCSFLNKDKKCDIYINLGKEKLCNTCKQYPRFIEEYASTREIGISLSCPEAARIILNNSKKVEFELEENEEIVCTYDDISYDMFIQIISSRKMFIDILQDRSIELNKRIAIILNFAKEIQEKIDTNKISEITSIRDKYSNDKFIKKLIDQLDNYKAKNIDKYKNIYKCLKVYQNINHINEEWSHVLKHTTEYFYDEENNVKLYVNKHDEFDKYYLDKIYEYEHLMVYFIFRYLMKSLYDYDVIAKVKLAILSYLITKELNVVRWCDNEQEFNKKDQVELMHMYSKDVEHSDENLEELAEIFETNKIFSLEHFMTMLMN
ncbi:flagellar protein FliB [Clostridium botulinum]|uniref:flagellin lysine-N-methylase n=1 Tax=Clostridium botulinum TaxID=1491 RepID=UPI0013CB8BE3|nr:flagellin lysine-N-methylase [Clostridium botulinum]MBY6917514.1 flagellin lysine-N-methylase [Clostridium botulinum]NFE74348.1 flagellar protein FliB [Clostridium botulinum]NFF82584.1 flagellar protein FliB [Clostridium botulinum]NFL35434.1 flagellar protein FliB [Clostridium botulinum]NFL59461.1 flagellar protein FliB [Clostridium botulinum]